MLGLPRKFYLIRLQMPLQKPRGALNPVRRNPSIQEMLEHASRTVYKLQVLIPATVKFGPISRYISCNQFVTKVIKQNQSSAPQGVLIPLRSDVATVGHLCSGVQGQLLWKY